MTCLCQIHWLSKKGIVHQRSNHKCSIVIHFVGNNDARLLDCKGGALHHKSDGFTSNIVLEMRCSSGSAVCIEDQTTYVPLSYILWATMMQDSRTAKDGQMKSDDDTALATISVKEQHEPDMFHLDCVEVW